MQIINNLSETKIKIGEMIVNVTDIEKIERQIFKGVKIKFKLKNETIFENYTGIKELNENFIKLIEKAGFNENGLLRKERTQLINGKIYLKNTIILARKIVAIRKIKATASMFSYYRVKPKIIIILSGGNEIIINEENERYFNYDYEQLEKIFNKD